MPDFALARAEFDRQGQVLLVLVKLVDSVTVHGAGNEAEQRALPPEGKNTMAAAAIVLLASHFEEFIRQQVQEYARSMVSEYSHLSQKELRKLTDSYWRGGTGKLSRFRPKDGPTWVIDASKYLRSLLAFPVEDRIDEFIADLISEHENNMRWDTITEITGRVCISNLGEAMFACEDLRNNINVFKRSDFSDALRETLNGFYEMRNGIVHSISQVTGVGPTVFEQWIGFFRSFSTGFETALNDAFTKFHLDVEERKAPARAPANTQGGGDAQSIGEPA